MPELVYEYWVGRRALLGNSLIRRFRVPPAFDNQDADQVQCDLRLALAVWMPVILHTSTRIDLGCVSDTRHCLCASSIRIRSLDICSVSLFFTFVRSALLRSRVLVCSQAFRRRDDGRRQSTRASSVRMKTDGRNAYAQLQLECWHKMRQVRSVWGVFGGVGSVVACAVGQCWSSPVHTIGTP